MRLTRVLVLGFIGISVGLYSPISASAQVLTVTNQIQITATILPSRHVITGPDGNIRQIISNTSEAVVEPTIYVGSIKPENMIPLTPEVSTEIAELLRGKTLKPGILYDYRNVDILPVNSRSEKSNPNIWLSGIFNPKNIYPTVKLTRL